MNDPADAMREAMNAMIDAMNAISRLTTENVRLRLALSVALPLLEQHGEHRAASLIRCAVGDCGLTGPVLIVDNKRRKS